MVTAGRTGRVAMMGALLIAEITGSFETAMIYAALSKLIAAFGDPIKAGWLVTSYLLVGAGAAAVAGRLGDIFGRRRVMMALLAVGAAGAALSASTGLFALVLCGRILQGVTGAILPLCIGIVREILPPAKVPVGVGVIISGASVGTAMGLVVGGLIVDHYSWHGIFAASALLCVLSFVAMALFVPPSRRAAPAGRLDWVGGVLFVPAIAGLLLYITNGRTWGWGDPRSLAVLAGSAALMAVWVVQALRSPDPLIDVRLFRNRRVLIANLVASLVCLGGLQLTLIFSVLLQAPRWTGVGLGVSASLAGLAKLPSNVSSTFVAPLSGWLATRHGGRFVLTLGGALMTVAWLLAMAFHDSVAAIVLVLILISAGGTTLYAVGPNIIVEAVPPDRTSEAVGMMTVVRQASIGIGAQLATVLLASDVVTAPGGAPSYPTEAAFLLAMGVIAALSAAATLVALLLPPRPAPQPVPGGRATGAAPPR